MIRYTTFALALLALGGPAPAADPHETVGAIPTAQQGLVTGLTALLVFALVFAVLATKVWPVITRALDERAAKIREEISAAEMARKQAKDALEMYEKSLAEARAEAARMLEQARAQQSQLAAELRAKGDAELVKMRDRARRDIEAAKRAAVAEVYEEGVKAATSMAARILEREINAGDQQRLIRETLGELEQVVR